MKRILTAKDGVTLLEGVIALGLLALVAGGAFAVLLSASRQTTQPDIREEVVLTVKGINDRLQALSLYRDSDLATDFGGYVPSTLGSGQDSLGAELGMVGLSWGTITYQNSNTITVPTKYLPPICDKNKSSFTRTIQWTPRPILTGTYEKNFSQMSAAGDYDIKYDIVCNGYQL